MLTIFECHIYAAYRVCDHPRGDAAVMSHIWENNIIMEAEQDG